MNPSVDRFLQVVTVHLLTRTSQELGPGYEQSNIMTLGAMMTAVQQEFERAAARRVAENNALKALFADAVAVLETDPEVGGRLSDAASSESASLAVSDLERENCRLRALLIELHAYVEQLDSPGARRIEQAIWDELAASTERRRLAIGPF